MSLSLPFHSFFFYSFNKYLNTSLCQPQLQLLKNSFGEHQVTWQPPTTRRLGGKKNKSKHRLQVSLHGQCFHFSPETGVKWREHRPEMPLTSKTQMSCLHSWLHCLFPAWENDAKGPGVPTVCDRALSLEGRMCPHSSLPWLTSFSCANLTSFLVKCPLKYFAHFKNCFSPLLVLEVFA